MIAVIGAGPAGLAAAKAAASAGQDVVIFDSAPRLGGQYWRHISQVSGYKSGRAGYFFDAVTRSPKIKIISGAQVWSAVNNGDSLSINYIVQGVEKSLAAQKLILATGAYDRSIPFPGWERPGVMTPGAAQALLKGHGVLAGEKIVVAGTGPFLLPVAVGLASAGAKVVGVYEAQSPLRWLLSPIALILNPEKLFELIYYIRQIRSNRLRIHFKRAVTSFDGSSASISKVNSDLTLKTGVPKVVACDVTAVGWGFAPDVSLGGILGCQQEVDTDGTVIFTVNRDQMSSVNNIWIAGEATGIGGSDLALIEGEIAGLSASGATVSPMLRFTKFRKYRFARALQRSYPVGNGWQSWLHDETKICRCEEISYHEICGSVQELGSKDSRSAKLFTRAGMGLCQGRICSRNVSEIIGEEISCEVLAQERIAYSNRPIAAPISLGMLSDGVKGNGAKDK